MEEGDRVRHKKYGTGVIKRLYPKHNAANVLYDSGHRTTNAQSKLTVIPKSFAEASDAIASSAAVAADGDKAPTKAKRRGGTAGSSQVDYKLLDRMVAAFRKMFPDAAKIVPLIYMGRPYSEIWSADGGAQIVFYEEKK